MTSISSAYVAMADAQAHVTDRPLMGLVDDRAAGLRAFMRYSRNYRHDVQDVHGKLRYMGRKQAAVWAILHRQAHSGERMTMLAIAKEANCVPSTVSRAVVRFQSWGQFAIDVTRGRHGGITVRLRHWGDNLNEYRERAWARLKHAARNVASTLLGRGGGSNQEESVYQVGTTYRDATFTGRESYDERITRLGEAIRAGTITIEEAVGPSRPATDADREFARCQEWAAEVIRERARLDREDPDWDLLLEQARERWIS